MPPSSYNLWNMVPWFKIMQINVSRNADLLTVLLDNGSMVHNQINMNRNGIDHLMCQLPTGLLENGSMAHNQTNTDRNGLLENGTNNTAKLREQMIQKILSSRSAWTQHT